MEANKIVKFDERAIKHQFLEKSTFSVLFAGHRLNYLKSVESFLKKILENKKIALSINYEECTMEVSTTKQTRDPYIIIKADEMIQLLSRGMTLEQASKVLEDDVFCDIIPTNQLCSDEKTLERRRNRINNPKILRAMYLLTKCEILIIRKAACIVGSIKGINDAKKIIIGCFENVHPAFEIKKLMIQKKLISDSVDGDWDRFMPKLAKTHDSRKIKSRRTGEMPADIKPRKEDVERETGEYYADPRNAKRDEKRERIAKRYQERRKEKAATED